MRQTGWRNRSRAKESGESMPSALLPHQLLPVEDDRDRAAALRVRLDHHEAPIIGDIERRRLLAALVRTLEQARWRLEVERCAGLDCDRHEVRALVVIELFAVARPQRLVAAVRRDADRRARSWKRSHPDFGYSCRIRRIGDPAAIG